MLRFESAHFGFGGRPLLENVTELLPEGARAGLIGRNGAGKTTLFRLILGELELESGKIVIPRDRAIAYLPQHPSLPEDETIGRHVLESHPELRELEEDLRRLEQKMEETSDAARLDRLVERHRALSREFESRGGYELESRVGRIIEGLGFSRSDIHRKIRGLSPGEKNRVAIAKVLLAEADVLLLDEPTNHLDFDMIEWFEEFLVDPPPGRSGASPTLLVASHDRWFLNRFTERIYELRDGSIHGYRGNYDAFAMQRSEELERKEKEYRLQQEAVARDLEFIRRNFAAQKARQAKSREKRLARLEIVERPEREAGGPAIRFGDIPRGGDDVLRLEGVACGYGEKVLLRDASFEMERGDRVAIIGTNGCGKTTLLRCIVGGLSPLEGTVHRGRRTVVGWYEQDVSRFGSAKTVFDEIHDLVPRWNDQDVLDLLAAFLFRGDEARLETSSLSGGEKARVALIRLILSGSNLLVLDEPTNHLDIYARAALERSLSEFPESILFVSHDRWFIDALATRVLAIQDGALRELPGGYEEYRELRRRERELREEKESRREAERSRPEKPPAKAAASLKREEERVMAAITGLEEEIRYRQEACGLEEHYRNPESMRRLKAEISDMEVRLAELYRAWEETLKRGS